MKLAEPVFALGKSGPFGGRFRLLFGAATFSIQLFCNTQGFSAANSPTDTPLESSKRVSPASVPAWSTNGPAVYAILKFSATNSLNSQPATLNQPDSPNNRVFDHYTPGSLNNLIWTNFIAHTNGRTMRVWEPRLHPPGWPAHPPIVAWNTNCLMWGCTGLTALSPCWEIEGVGGQVPVTALTKRHGYTRGHGLGADGFSTNLIGMKVWFVATNQTVIEMTVLRSVARTFPGGAKRDYSILLFNRDLPDTIEPMRVVAATNVPAKYPACPGAPRPVFKTEQWGGVSAEVPGFSVNTWKGGDSGSPDMLPMPGELVFFGGRSTSGPSPEMQSDMDALCVMSGLDSHKYQLQWLDLSGFPTYALH